MGEKVQFSQRGYIISYELDGLFLPVAWEIQVLRKDRQRCLGVGFSSPGQEVILSITHAHRKAACAPGHKPHPETDRLTNRWVRKRGDKPEPHRQATTRRTKSGTAPCPAAPAWRQRRPPGQRAALLCRAPPGHRLRKAGTRPAAGESRGQRPPSQTECNRKPATGLAPPTATAARPIPTTAYLPATPAAATAALPSLTPAAGPPPQRLLAEPPASQLLFGNVCQGGAEGSLDRPSRVSGTSPW